MERLERLTPLAEDGVIEIKTIQGLDTTPEMTASQLKQKFDENVKQLTAAIDKYVINPINEANLVARSELSTFGGGDMMREVYDTNNDGMVDKAKSDANGNTIATHYATKSELSSGLANILDNSNARAEIIDLIYPVGSLYLSLASTNPSSWLGGSWELYSKGQVLTGVDPSKADYNTSNKTGGSETRSISSHTHSLSAATTGSTTLTSEQMPAHTHSANVSVNTVAHTHTLTPAGTISKHSHTLTPSGTISAHNHSFTPSGSVASHTHSFTPSGSISGGAHSHTVSLHWYKVGSGEGSVYRYLTPEGSTSKSVTAASNTHSHTFSGSAGTTGGTAPKFTGTAGTTGNTTPTFTGKSGSTSEVTSTFTGTKGTTSENSHTHTVSVTNASVGGGSGHTHTIAASTTGSNSAATLDIRQPYATCYIWKRTV